MCTHLVTTNLGGKGARGGKVRRRSRVDAKTDPDSRARARARLRKKAIMISEVDGARWCNL